MTVDLIRPFGFVIETVSDEPAFLSESPLKVMMEGRYNKIPMMIGFTSREGMLSEIGIKREHGVMKLFTDFEKKVPFFYNLEKGTEMSLKVAKMIKEYYFGHENPSLDNLDKFYLVNILKVL